MRPSCRVLEKKKKQKQKKKQQRLSKEVRAQGALVEISLDVDFIRDIRMA